MAYGVLAAAEESGVQVPEELSLIGSAPDDHTVIVKLKQPSVPILWYLGGQTYILPQHLWSSVSNPVTYTNPDPVGTGPFVFKSFTPQLYVFDRNPHYWQAGKPYINEIRYPAFNSKLSAAQHALLPAFTIVVSSLAGWLLGMRNAMMTTLSEDYVLMAQAKGLSERRVMLAYAARNACAATSFNHALAGHDADRARRLCPGSGRHTRISVARVRCGVPGNDHLGHHWPDCGLLGRPGR